MEGTWEWRCLAFLLLVVLLSEREVFICILHQGDQLFLPMSQIIHRSFKFSEHIVYVHQI